MSKRKLLELVKSGYVTGWDDPRMPTICGLRRRGYTPESIRLFANRVGVAKRDNVIDLELLEWCVREDLNKRAQRFMAVLDPVKVVITNYPDDKEECFEVKINPEDLDAGIRKVTFGRNIYIERDDFMENPPKKYFRLQPGGEVRLKYSYIIKCEEVIKDESGEIVELHCTYDPESRGAHGVWRSVKGTIHWVSATHALDAEVRLFDRLFTEANMDEIPKESDYMDFVNCNSLKTVKALIEPDLAAYSAPFPVQFERLGYFVLDIDSTGENKVFNRTVTLKDNRQKLLNTIGK